MKSDAQLKNDVAAELKWEPSVHDSDIKINANNGVVTLEGTVPNYAEKQAAERAAQRVAGVLSITDQLGVKLPGLQKLPDQEIVVIVVNTLKSHAWIPNHIKATVEGGWVTLSGEVAQIFQRQACEDAVRFLTGVIGVKNHVKVKANTQSVTINEGIEKALRRNSAIAANRITVTSDGGRVTLNGVVCSLHERSEVCSTAWRAPGVTHVDDQLVLAERANTAARQVEQV